MNGSKGPGSEDWHGYRVFLAVVDEGTLSAAAGVLGLSQPTVGRRIDALEKRLGLLLFERRPEGLQPTPAARRVLPKIRRLAHESAMIDADLRGEDESFEHPIRIATTTAFGALSLTPHVASLRTQFPELRIELKYGLGLVDILRGEADIVLRQARPGSAELVGRRIAKITVGLWAGETYLQTSGSPRRRADLALHQTIEASGDLERIPGAAWLRASRGSDRVPILCSDLLGIFALAQAGQGIALMPRYVASQSSSLHRILPRQANWETDLWLLTRRELRTARRVRVVIDHLVGCYRGAVL